MEASEEEASKHGVQAVVNALRKLRGILTSKGLVDDNEPMLVIDVRVITRRTINMIKTSEIWFDAAKGVKVIDAIDNIVYEDDDAEKNR
jgi:hypothetical protein